MGKKDRRAEIPDKKARKTAAAAKEEAKEHKEVPKIKGCHVSIDVCGGCIRPKDPVPEANSQDGVKMACSNHHCPFSITRSVHKDCFQKLTDKVVNMLLRTGSSSWTDEQRVENAWRKKGLTFVGKFITCPCGHGTQTLEDSENRWSRNGEVVLDPEAYEKHREEKIKKALKQEKPAPTQPKTLNTTFGGKEQAELARKLARREAEMDANLSRGDGPAGKQQKKKDAAKSSSWNPFSSPTVVDDDGFTTIGKDGRARDLSSIPAPEKKGPQPLSSIIVPPLQRSAFQSPLASASPGNRAERGRTTSCGSGASWLTSSSNLPPENNRKGRGGGGAGDCDRKKGRKGNKENQQQHANGATAKSQKRPFGYAMLSGSEDEMEDEEEQEEAPNMQSSLRSFRDFSNDFHSYSEIEYWSHSEVKEFNEHLALFQSDSALFQCRVTGRKLREPTIIKQLTPATAWIFTTQAMAQKADIPPGTQVTLQEYYAIFHGHDIKNLEDPIIWCKDGTLAALECVDITMLIMGK